MRRNGGTGPLAGTDLTRLAGSVLDPRWVGKFDTAYTWKKLRLTYELYYLPRTLYQTTSTVENRPTPWIDANVQHRISATYQATKELTIRGGIVNLMDEMPSYSRSLTVTSSAGVTSWD